MKLIFNKNKRDHLRLSVTALIDNMGERMILRKLIKTIRKNKSISRKALAKKYIHGEGIEIGALHNPLPIDNNTVKIKYVDRKPLSKLLEHYPEVRKEKLLVNPDIIAPAEDLSIIADSSQDFVIENHLLEHAPDPIKVLMETYRVTKKNEGIIFISFPNINGPYASDRERDITTLDHLKRDHIMEDSERRVFDFIHFWQWMFTSNKIPETIYKLDDVTSFTECLNKAIKLYDMDYSIHYHVFNEKTFTELIKYMKQDFNTEFKIIYKCFDLYECIFILRPIL
ncbi:MAG: methyltransferase domain-containing protein [Candidatus Cloacimonetes bacterium]|nr:methyltransferase domain-containing protein [Candidatus Cloacimonadota bacterium]